jgi:hypothetical protein
MGPLVERPALELDAAAGDVEEVGDHHLGGADPGEPALLVVDPCAVGHRTALRLGAPQ